MTIIRVAVCAFSLAFLAGCASSGFRGQSAYGGGGGSVEFSANEYSNPDQGSSLPEYREILAHPGHF